MPQNTDPRAYAEAAIASLSTLATLDSSLAPAIAAAIGALRAKYPAVSVGPGGGIDPGATPTA